MEWTKFKLHISKIKIILLFLLIDCGFEWLINKIADIHLSEISILPRVIVALVIIIIHELIHYVTDSSVVKSRGRVHFGLIARKMLAFCQIDGEYTYRAMLIGIISPFVILTILLGIFLWLISAQNAWIWYAVFCNALLAIGDIYQFCFILVNCNDNYMFKIENMDLYVRINQLNKPNE